MPKCLVCCSPEMWHHQTMHNGLLVTDLVTCSHCGNDSINHVTLDTFLYWRFQISSYEEYRELILFDMWAYANHYSEMNDVMTLLLYFIAQSPWMWAKSAARRILEKENEKETPS